MDNQAPPTNSTVENPPAQNLTPTSSKSFLSNKILLPVVILLLIFAAGGTYLALNSKPKPQPYVSKIIPTSAPTPTPDPTANWKTYRSKSFRFSIKYPPTWSIKTELGNLGGKNTENTLINDSEINRSNNSRISIYGNFQGELCGERNFSCTEQDTYLGGLKWRRWIYTDSREVYYLNFYHYASNVLDEIVIFTNPRDQKTIVDQILSTFKSLDTMGKLDSTNVRNDVEPSSKP